jgi:prepilin-type N-terminal cleavage/methylation domain-containing protein
LPSDSRSDGFTLIEVLAAVLIVCLVFGLLLESVTRNLHDLSRARAEARAAQLAEDRLTALGGELATGEKLEDGVKQGVFEEPDADMHWQISVTPQTLALPADYKGELPPSPLFAVSNEPTRAATPGQEPPLRLVQVRVFAEGVDPESVEPFVVLVTRPPDPARLQQLQQQQQQQQPNDPNAAKTPKPDTSGRAGRQ